MKPHAFQVARRLQLLLCTITLLTINMATPLARADDVVPTDPAPRWWKGNIHTHTLWSDGDDFPEMVAEWYRTHGYNFLALSDHNILSEGQRWMEASAISQRGGDDVVDKYLKRFGPHWVEVKGAASEDKYSVRLKPLNEFRSLVEQRGEFIMMTGEEISDFVDGKPVHMNATNLRDLLQPLGGETVAAAIRANLRAAEDQAARLGREILVHVNHPNFHYAITAEDLAAVVEERFFEVYNGHPVVNHLGDADRPSVERMWDIANTIRLAQWRAAPLLGIATDDSHSYHSPSGSTPGRGWVMVKARHLTAESLIRAMKRSDVYASSGVTLRTIEFDVSSGTLTVAVEPRIDVTYTIDFIGTRMPNASESVDNSIDAASIGTILASHEAPKASYTLSGNELFVRALITSSQPHPNPSYKDQRQQAWCQPVGWQRHID